jgi:hypothetical protein
MCCLKGTRIRKHQKSDYLFHLIVVRLSFFSEEVFRQKTEKEDFFSNEAFQPISLELEKKYAALSDSLPIFLSPLFFHHPAQVKRFVKENLGNRWVRQNLKMLQKVFTQIYLSGFGGGDSCIFFRQTTVNRDLKILRSQVSTISSSKNKRKGFASKKRFVQKKSICFCECMNNKQKSTENEP